jgi:hypothetical protein
MSNIYIWNTEKESNVSVLGIKTISKFSKLKEDKDKNFKKTEEYVLKNKILDEESFDNSRATVFYSIDKTKDEYEHLDGFFVNPNSIKNLKNQENEKEKIILSEEFAKGLWATIEFKGEKKLFNRVPENLNLIEKWASDNGKKLSKINENKINLVEWYVKDVKIGFYSLGIYWRIEKLKKNFFF